jgi:hypothetical protein
MKYFSTDFIGIGAAKCGTTWLHHCLEEHPEICMPSPKKEPGFYDNHWEDWTYYKSLFSHREKEKVTGEFTPGYLTAVGVSERIAQVNPEAKIIFIVRNPIERAYSHYCMLLKGGAIKGGPEGIVQGTRMFRDSQYWKHFSPYLELFPDDQIMVLIQEEMLASPVLTLKRIFNFLGVDPAFTPSLANERIHSRSSRPKHQNLYRRLVALSDFAHKNRITGRLFDEVRNRGVGRLYRLFDKGKKFPAMTEVVRAKLREEFQQDVRELFNYIGRPVKEWKRDFPKN